MNNGNAASISNNINSARTQSFTYDGRWRWMQMWTVGTFSEEREEPVGHTSRAVKIGKLLVCLRFLQIV
jgi:hypothetical protein